MTTKKEILFKILQKAGINVLNNNNNIPLSEFISKILLIKTIIPFIKNHNIQSTSINNINCIDLDQAIKLIEKSTKNEVKHIFKNINDIPTNTTGTTSDDNMLDLINNILKYNGKNVQYIIDQDNNPWFKGNDTAILLDYADPRRAIYDHVNENDKQKLEKIRKVELTSPIFNENESIYINVSGFFDLIFGSKMKEAKRFRYWVTHDVLPVLYRTGQYRMNVPKSIYLNKNISEYYNKNVIYIAYVGRENGYDVYKIGISDRMFERDYNEHRQTFGDEFQLILLEECDNNKKIEDMILRDLKVRNIWLSTYISKNGKTQKECFISTNEYTIEFIMLQCKDLIQKYPLQAVKDRDNIIRQLQDNNELKIKRN